MSKIFYNIQYSSRLLSAEGNRETFMTIAENDIQSDSSDTYNKIINCDKKQTGSPNTTIRQT